MENSGRLLGANRSICVHYTDSNSSHQLRRNWSALIQEALYHGVKSFLPTGIFDLSRDQEFGEIQFLHQVQ